MVQTNKVLVKTRVVGNDRRSTCQDRNGDCVACSRHRQCSIHFFHILGPARSQLRIWRRRLPAKRRSYSVWVVLKDIIPELRRLHLEYIGLAIGVARSLVGTEEESLVLDQRAANICAELVIDQRRLLGGKVV